MKINLITPEQHEMLLNINLLISSDDALVVNTELIQHAMKFSFHGLF